MRRVWVLGVAMAALAAGAVSAAEVSGIDGQKVSDHIKILASDAFEGRGPATPGEAKTVAYMSGALHGLDTRRQSNGSTAL